MTIIYVDSGAGEGGNNGTSKVNAYLHLSSATPNAGDEVWINATHNELETTGKIYSSGAPGAPVAYKCMDFSTNTDTTGAIIRNNAGITLRGDQIWTGVELRAGENSTGVLTIADQNGRVRMEHCVLYTIYGGSYISIGTNASSSIYSEFEAYDLTLRFSNTGQSVIAYRCRFSIEKLALHASSSLPVGALFNLQQAGSYWFYNGDFTPLGTGKYLFNQLNGPIDVFLVDCDKDNAVNLWVSAPGGPGGGRVYEMGTDGANTTYQYKVSDYQCPETIDVATYITTGGAAQGATKYSHKLAGAHCAFWHPSKSQWFKFWNTSTGSAKTVKIQLLYDGTAAPTNAKVWGELLYRGSPTRPKGTLVSTRCPLSGTPTTLATGVGTGAWTKGAPQNTWYSLEIPFSVTPEQVGWIKGRVCLAINEVVYASPKMSIT